LSNGKRDIKARKSLAIIKVVGKLSGLRVSKFPQICEIHAVFAYIEPTNKNIKWLRFNKVKYSPSSLNRKSE
jgi:hypothetical protein